MRYVSLLLAVFLITTCSISSAQSYDLELLNTSIPTQVIMGTWVPVEGDIRNNGPNTFYADSGKIRMNVHARYTPVAPADTFDVVPITSFDIEIDSLSTNQVLSYKGEFFADINNFRTGHSGITVIIWPRLGIGDDSDIPNHFFASLVNAVDSSIVNSLEDQLNEAAQVSIYPNPASEWVEIELPEARTGKISLMDLKGTEIVSVDANRGNKVYQISLAKHKLPTGIYLISFEGESIAWTKKLIISKN